MRSLFQRVLILLACLAGGTIGDEATDASQGPQAEILVQFPSQGDLLIGREANLNASSTCGEKEPIRVCPIGAPCFTCDSKKSHDKATVKDSYKIENAVGKIHSSNTTYSTWWLSQPGQEHITIDFNLENKFTFTHLIMIFRGYRPKAWYLERSSDYGTTYKPYGYFAEKCEETFPSVRIGRRQNIDDVVCSSAYTGITPSDKGQVVFNSVPQHIHELDRSSRHDQEMWMNQTEITNLRINLYKFHTLTDDKSLDKYFYGLYEMNVHGMCICNGHATRCKPANDMYLMNNFMVHSQCECKHNTQGPHCERCLDFYNDRKWAPATLFSLNECRRCQCHGHTNRCVFSQAQWDRTGGKSGGQCLDCQHNTTGDHCERCEVGFYRDDQKTLEDPDVCVACDCYQPGIREAFCEQETNKAKSLIAGHCFCKANVAGRRCDRCQPGFWNLQANNSEGCIKCGCALEGTVGNEGCNQYTGQCPCKVNVEGETCNRCKPGFYNLSMSEDGCSPCNCDIGGSLSSYCDTNSGNCKCKIGFVGRRCDQLAPGYFVPQFHMDGRVVDISESPDISRFPRITRPEETTLTGSQGLRVRSPTQRTPDSLRIPLREKTIGLPTGVYIIAVKLYPISVNNSINLPTILSSGSASVNCSQRLPRKSSTLRIPSTIEFLRQQQLTGPLRPSVSQPYTVLEAAGPVCIDAEGLDSLTIDLGPVTPADNIVIDGVLIMRNWNSPIGTLLNRTQHTTGRGSFEPQPVSKDKVKSMETSLYNCLDYWNPEQQIAARMPDECRQLVQSLSSYRLTGAMRCACNPGGTIGQQGSVLDCEKLGGQCNCLPNVIKRTCSECAANHYGFGQFPNEGCRPCNCSLSGSVTSQCDSVSGQCICQTTKIAGRRCDSCLQGYWLFPVCQPCQCNGLALDCDKYTGDCLNCQNNTGGRECQDCSPGYYGDPKRRIPCRRCQCPGGRDGRVQHAATCQLKSSTPPAPVCNCEPGYIGDSCERCDVNFYGDPTTGVCTRCSCNGNINFSVPNSCDPNNGMCIKCLNYTTGVSCELCRKGFYGQAAAGRCLPCRCNPLGTEPAKELSNPVPYESGGIRIDITHSCDGSTGQCTCLPNVEGTNCDACKPRHYNLTSGAGCSPCDCDPIGSANDMCNVITGQCPCKSNRGGRRCDQCLDLYYGDPSKGRDGCQPCDCHPEGSLTPRCDKVTGRCVCKSAITGRRCDSCERGTTGTLPNCTTCGECWYSWDKIIGGLGDKSDDLQRQSDWVGKTGNIAGELGAIVNETVGDLNKVLIGINQTQVSVDQVTDVQNRLSGLRNQLDSSNVVERTRQLSQQTNKTKSDWASEEQMLRPIDESNQLHLNPKRKIAELSNQLDTLSRSVKRPNLDVDQFGLLQAEENFNLAAENFSSLNATLIQPMLTRSGQDEANFTAVINAVEALNLTAQNRSKQIKDAYESIEKKLPELNRVMCVGFSGENASLYSRSRNYCSELCGGPSAEVCSSGGVDLQCASASVCDKSVVAQLRFVNDSSRKLLEKLSNDTLEKLKEESNILIKNSIATALNNTSVDLDNKVNSLKSQYDNLKQRAEELQKSIDNFLASNGSSVEDVQKSVDSIRGAARVFSDDEINELSTRLSGLMEKLPREFNVSKIREETRNIRDNVAELTSRAARVMSETQTLQSTAGGLTKQLSNAQAGVGPSREALATAEKAVDGLDDVTTRMTGTLSNYNQQVESTDRKLSMLKERRAASTKASIEAKIVRLGEEQRNTARNLSDIDQKLSASLSSGASNAVEISEAEQLRRSAIIEKLQQRLRQALVQVGSDRGQLADLSRRADNLEASMATAAARLTVLLSKLNGNENEDGSLAKMSTNLANAMCKGSN